MLADLSAAVMESCANEAKVYNDLTLHTFFEAYIDSSVLVEWLRKVTNSMSCCCRKHNYFICCIYY